MADQALKRMQRRSPFEDALHKSPFETPTVQEHVADVVSESAAGKEQLQLFSKGAAAAAPKAKHLFPPPRQGQRIAPGTSPFDHPPPGLGPRLPCLTAPHKLSTGADGSPCFDWQLVKQMGSSMEDILSIVGRLSSSLGHNEGIRTADPGAS
ncbi:unnamed protein product [Ostreobium quekettii]|uniref:Uncharacterized protein n=1 Tax=Ostreobium quekettii TaxID=121088 RepID=A0A8S1IP17_9CHLO|nr:unnamed protein product [Ostreobium quekettii]